MAFYAMVPNRIPHKIEYAYWVETYYDDGEEEESDPLGCVSGGS